MTPRQKKGSKNHHFVPQFFQRFFSYENNRKTIGMYNIRHNQFRIQVPIPSQLSSPNFYGRDGELEDWLSKHETDCAPLFREMLETEKLPIFQSSDHFKMMQFMIILDLRNPVHFKILNYFAQKLRNTKSKISEGNVSPDMIPSLEKEQTDQGKMSSLQSAGLIAKDVMDLKYKLIKNTSASPFIISDNPLVMYNQFLEKRKWKFCSQRDYGFKGIQFFLPLNDSHMLAVYDSDIYKLGNKKQLVVKIDDKSSIDQLNILQFLNSETTVNFNHRASEHYIRMLHEKSKKYKKANDGFISVHALKPPKVNDNFTAQLIEMGVSDLNIKLSVQKLNFISKSCAVRMRTIEDQYRKNTKLKGNTLQVFRLTPIIDNIQ
ncbi:DUF4238 domain-containing protein [Flavobacterium quisquiliarum]|uniref:DUF4238 domain-containing protein n=1 Tax=Flavobacterium quisquiliarum TaxID=1834436 RepID=A0ABV8W2G8_9FLAO|nr:DUF4238 domain-containing protein [Flavobacterium quisquiliarum]MBW1655913.1 DUF4238 domain-containing protein [Flavobacterium quisquiliarum]